MQQISIGTKNNTTRNNIPCAENNKNCNAPPESILLLNGGTVLHIYVNENNLSRSSISLAPERWGFCSQGSNQHSV